MGAVAWGRDITMELGLRKTIDSTILSRFATFLLLLTPSLQLIRQAVFFLRETKTWHSTYAAHAAPKTKQERAKEEEKEKERKREKRNLSR